MTFIISLGEIFKPDFQKTILKFHEIFKQKGASVTPQAIGGFVQAQMPLIDQFKKGEIDENNFDQQILQAIKSKFNIDLTIAEFNTAWNAMHQYDLIKAEEILNGLAHEDVIFVSFTNPKDVRAIIQTLTQHPNIITFETTNDTLAKLAGKNVLISYLPEHKTDKTGLVRKAFHESDARDVFYLAGENEIQDSSLHQALEAERTNLDHETPVHLSILDSEAQSLLEQLLQAPATTAPRV